MGVKFIYGKSGSGKSHYCLQSIKKRIEDNSTNSLILLVPEQFSFQSEKNLIEFAGERSILKAQVLSFRRMADHILDEVGGGINRHINDSGKNILIYKIIEENRDNLKVFKKTSRNQGLVSNMSNTIKELKKYNITADILRGSLDGIENVSLRSKLEDIIVIFSEFQDRLSRAYIDEEDMLSMLAEKLDESKMFSGAEVWVDEFSSFTPQEYTILEKLMRKSSKVNFTLCMDFNDNAGTDLFLPTKLTEKKLLELCEKNNISYEKPVVLNSSPCYKFKDNKELQHLEHYLFSYPYAEYKYNTNNINIFKALNKYTEVSNTANDIIRICRDKKFRFKDVAVVTGDLDGYESIVKAVFNQYDIPYFIDKRRSIDSNPIIVLIISVVEIISKNWSYESVFRYLKTGLLDIELSDIDILENYVLQNGIKGSVWLKEEPWKFKTIYSINEDKENSYMEEFVEKINSIRDRVREPIIRLSQSIKGRKNGEDKCRGLYEFLCDIKIPEKVENIIGKFQQESKLDIANEYSQIWDIVVDTLDQIVDTIGKDSFSLDTFAQVLTSGFKEYEIGVIPPALDQVLVGNVTRIRSHDVRALYIIGVNDGVFPSTIPSNGVITDADREELKERGIEISENARTKAFEEQFLMYTTLTIMDRYIRLSYSMGDDNGKTKRPSIIISRIKKLFPALIEESDVMGQKIFNDINNISVPSGTFNGLIENITKNISSEKLENSIWIDVYRWYSTNKNWNTKLNNVLKGFYYTNEAEITDTSKVRKLYGRHMNMSVSKLEKFVQCPFAYFVQYGLKAKQRKIYNLSPPDLGSFMHSMLEIFSKKLREENLTWRDIDRKWCSEKVSEIIKTTLDNRGESILNSSSRYRHVTRRINRVITRAVWLITEHIKKSKFNPAGYEVSFGNHGDFPPISVKLHSSEDIELVGRVDRIDMMEKDGISYLRVIDYKSGVKEFNISDLYYGLQIQLLVYLDVILDELESKMNKAAIPGGILYFKLDDPIVNGKGNITYNEIEKNIMKSLRMNGLLLDDADIIKDMDNEISGPSNIIPASLKKDGNISSSKSSVATMNQFSILRKYVRKLMAELCERILEGDIEVCPYKDNVRKGCDFCLYSSICQFDTLIKGSRYNNFEKKSTVEIWKEIEQSVNN